jgi:hypothetical protein
VGAGAADVPRAAPDPRLDFLAGTIIAGLLCLAVWLLIRNVAHDRRLKHEVERDAQRCVLREEDFDQARMAADPVMAQVHLVRRARWASLRYQEALYRMLLVVAVCGGLIPPAMVVAAGAWRARPSAVTPWAAVVAVAAMVMLLAALGFAVMVLAKWRARHSDDFNRRLAMARGLGDMWRANVAARVAVLVLGTAYLVLTLAYAAEIAGQAALDPVSFTLLFYRAWRLDGGVSPLLPLGIAAAAFLAWCAWHLRRLAALRRMTAFEAACLTAAPEVVLEDPDDPAACDSFASPPHPFTDFEPWERVMPRGVVVAVLQVRERLFRLVPLRGAGWLALGLVLMGGAVFIPMDRTLEHLAGWRAFDTLYRLGLAGVLAVTAWAVYRLLVVWVALRRTLRAVAGTPLLTAFERLPQRVSRLTRLGFIGVPRSAVIAPIAAAQWRHLHRLADALHTPSPPDAEWALREAARDFATLPPPDPGLGTCGDERALGTSFLALAGVLETFWMSEPGRAAAAGVRTQVEKESGSRGQGPSTSGRIRRTFSEELGLWIRAGEEYAAVQVVDYVEWVIGQLRVLAAFLFISVILLTQQISSYPFVPESLIKLLLFGMLLATIVAVLKVMVEMNRDEVLSRIARTEPGKVSWDLQFVLNALLFGLVPLLTLVSSEFPGIGDFLFAWIGPLTRMAGHG